MAGNVIPLRTDDAADRAELRHLAGFHLLLPLPPSDNKLTATVAGRRRIKTKQAREWNIEAGWHVKEALRKGEVCIYDEPVHIHIYIRPRTLKSGKPDINRSDAPNYLKALLDLLTPPRGRKKHGQGLIPDDSMAWLKHGSFTVVEHDDLDNAIPPGWCRMVVKPIAKPEDET